jgi:hypothetical protein
VVGHVPFNVTFGYGDGSSATPLSGTTLTSKTYNHQFYPCFETTYTQTLKVTDHLGLVSTSQAQTQVQPGSIC